MPYLPLYRLLLEDGIDLPTVKIELTNAVNANAVATPTNPASVASIRAKEAADAATAATTATVVDERTKLAAKGVIPTPTPISTTSPATATTSLTSGQFAEIQTALNKMKAEDIDAANALKNVLSGINVIPSFNPNVVGSTTVVDTSGASNTSSTDNTGSKYTKEELIKLRQQWQNLMNNFPPEDRVSFEDWLAGKTPTTKTDTSTATVTDTSTTTVTDTSTTTVTDTSTATVTDTSTATVTDTSTATVNTSTATTTTTTSTSTTTPVNTSDTQLTALIAALTEKITELTGKVNEAQNKPTMVGQVTRREKGGIVKVVALYSDNTEKVIDQYTDFSARDAALKMFENTGLGQDFINSLMASIDKVYADNVAPTDAQILNSIYTSGAYEKRFAGNKIIRERMAKGEGRPGDRVLTPAEYVKTEAAYKEIMSEAGLPPGFYDQPEDFTKFIAELGTSVSEITERVNIAQQALQNADANIKQALKDYYGLSDQDMVAYLLDSEKAFDAINSRFRYTTAQAKEMYTSAEVGGAALRSGMQGGVSEAFAKEITKAGKANLAEEAFQKSVRQQGDYERLMGLYGEKAGKEDLARESLALAGGAEVGIKTKKLASKERAKFATRTAVDRSSLGSRLKTPDV